MVGGDKDQPDEGDGLDLWAGRGGEAGGAAGQVSAGERSAGHLRGRPGPARLHSGVGVGLTSLTNSKVDLVDRLDSA